MPTAEKDLGVQPRLPRKHSFSSSDFSSPHFLHPLLRQQHRRQGSSTRQPRSPCDPGAPPEQYFFINTLHRKRRASMEKIVYEHQNKCIKTFLHQSSNGGRLHILTATISQLLQSLLGSLNSSDARLGRKPSQVNADLSQRSKRS